MFQNHLQILHTLKVSKNNAIKKKQIKQNYYRFGAPYKIFKK